MAGIYSIVNKVSKKTYIGRTKREFEERWLEHIEQLNNNSHANLYLQKDWGKQGINSFDFSVVEDVKELDEIPLKELQYISKYTKSSCYNAIFRKATNVVKAIEPLLMDKTLKVYLECEFDDVLWSMVVKNNETNKVYYFIKDLENKKNVEQRKMFIAEDERRIIVDMDKPIRNYHKENQFLYKLVKRR